MPLEFQVVIRAPIWTARVASWTSCAMRNVGRSSTAFHGGNAISKFSLNFQLPRKASTKQPCHVCKSPELSWAAYEPSMKMVHSWQFFFLDVLFKHWKSVEIFRAWNFETHPTMVEEISQTAFFKVIETCVTGSTPIESMYGIFTYIWLILW